MTQLLVDLGGRHPSYSNQAAKLLAVDGSDLDGDGHLVPTLVVRVIEVRVDDRVDLRRSTHVPPGSFQMMRSKYYGWSNRTDF